MGDTAAANKARAEHRAGRLMVKDDIAKFLGYSPSWIEKLIKRGAPVKIKGRPGVSAKIDSAQFVQFMIELERTKIEEKYSGMIGDVTSDDEAKRRYNIARAEREEIMVRKIRGEIVDLAVLERVLMKAVADTRSLLLGIPSKAAPILAVKTDPNEINNELKTIIYEALDELSGIDVARFIDEEVLQFMGAAAEIDGEPVGGQA